MYKRNLLIVCAIFSFIQLFSQSGNVQTETAYPRETNEKSLRFSKLDTSNIESIIYHDVDKDGDVDVIERWWKNKRVRWFDENDDASYNDVWGDMVNDALQVDMDGDGFFDGPADYNVKWADRDNDGIPDIQIFNSNPKPNFKSVFGASGAVYFVLIDPDNTGMLTDIKWGDLSVSWTRLDRGPNWRTNYHGNATFLKEHAPIWAVETPEYSWENPFLFYDFDDDGLAEMSIRVADNRVFKGEDKNILKFDGIVDEAWCSYDLDNDTGHDNEMDYDLTIFVAGGQGVNYKDEIHEYPILKAPKWVLPFYRKSEWRKQTKFRYLKRETAEEKLLTANWARAFLTIDEDDDSHRWERVEIYYPGDPYLLKRRSTNSPIYHPQSDALGDRGEWDTDYSGKAKLYRADWDGKIHLHGAEKGVWLVDIDRKYWAGSHPNGVASTKMPEKVEEVIQYFDSDNNGFFDVVIYDYDGDKNPERIDSLIQLGISDESIIMDKTKMSWEEFCAENSKSAKQSYHLAQQLFRISFKYGFVDNDILALSKASSVQEKYQNAYWMKERILRKLLEKACDEMKPKLLKAYYGNNIVEMESIMKKIQ